MILNETAAASELATTAAFDTNDDLDCPIATNDTEHLYEQFNFWVEGVSQTLVAIPGLLGNILFCYVLTRKEMLSSFNLLLVALSVFDSCYLVGAFMESVRLSFDMATDIHKQLFPYLLYPGQMFALTGSIFMIVAITFERYIAVHNPLDYNLAMNDADAIKTRLAKYLLPVVVSAAIFNIPKFFESYVKFTEEQDENGQNVTKVELDITELRVHPVYSTYDNWSQSLVLGFIPAALLVYFNTKIYQDIRERERRKRPRKRSFFGHRKREAATASEIKPIHKSSSCGNQGENCDGGDKTPIGEIGSNEVLDPDAVVSSNGQPDKNDSADQTPAAAAAAASSSSALKVPTKPRLNADAEEGGGAGGPLAAAAAATTAEENGGGGGEEGRTASPTIQQKTNNARRRKTEDKMAMIFIAIVSGFLVTNFPRIFLNFHEVLVFEKTRKCLEAGKGFFPVWSRLLVSFSHLLLVVNSSLNIIFYGLFNKNFRQVAQKIFFACFPSLEKLLQQQQQQEQQTRRDQAS